MTDDQARAPAPRPRLEPSERDYLMAIAEKVEALGRECADSVTVVVVGGYTVTYTDCGTWINFSDGRPSYPLLWHQQEQEERAREGR